MSEQDYTAAVQMGEYAVSASSDLLRAPARAALDAVLRELYARTDKVEALLNALDAPRAAPHPAAAAAAVVQPEPPAAPARAAEQAEQQQQQQQAADVVVVSPLLPLPLVAVSAPHPAAALPSSGMPEIAPAPARAPDAVEHGVVAAALPTPLSSPAILPSVAAAAAAVHVDDAAAEPPRTTSRRLSRTELRFKSTKLNALMEQALRERAAGAYVELNGMIRATSTHVYLVLRVPSDADRRDEAHEYTVHDARYTGHRHNDPVPPEAGALPVSFLQLAADLAHWMWRDLKLRVEDEGKFITSLFASTLPGARDCDTLDDDLASASKLLSGGGGAAAAADATRAPAAAGAGRKRVAPVRFGTSRDNAARNKRAAAAAAAPRPAPAAAPNAAPATPPPARVASVAITLANLTTPERSPLVNSPPRRAPPPKSLKVYSGDEHDEEEGEGGVLREGEEMHGMSSRVVALLKSPVKPGGGSVRCVVSEDEEDNRENELLCAMQSNAIAVREEPLPDEEDEPSQQQQKRRAHLKSRAELFPFNDGTVASTPNNGGGPWWYQH